MAEDIRAAHPGITNDDPMLKRWIDTWWEANGEIKTANEKFVEDSLARLDSFIQQADNFNWWDNIDTTKVDMMPLRRKRTTRSRSWRPPSILRASYMPWQSSALTMTGMLSTETFVK